MSSHVVANLGFLIFAGLVFGTGIEVVRTKVKAAQPFGFLLIAVSGLMGYYAIVGLR